MTSNMKIFVVIWYFLGDLNESWKNTANKYLKYNKILAKA